MPNDETHEMERTARACLGAWERLQSYMSAQEQAGGFYQDICRAKADLCRMIYDQYPPGVTWCGAEGTTIDEYLHDDIEMSLYASPTRQLADELSRLSVESERADTARRDELSRRTGIPTHRLP